MARWSRAAGCAGTSRFRALSLCAVVALGTLACLLAGSRTADAQQPAGIRASTSQMTVTVPLVARDYASPGAGNTLSRFGVGTPAQYDVNTYPLGPLSAGWYWNWTAQPDASRPSGVDYYATVRLDQISETQYAYTPDAATIARTAAAHPGTVWFIGNEPDRVECQDDIVPALYAAAYGELYTLIKAYDPTALIGAGNIVQPTPVRLAYLDRVLSSYGGSMPVDVWVIHDYPLREDYPLTWGAGIPPTLEDLAWMGLPLEMADHTDVDLFASLIVDFRAWMAANGYRNTPLILSEFGVLMPNDYAEFGEPQTIAFMNAAFDRLNSMTDPSTGYPPDGSRLVQRWAWYNLTGRGSDPSETGRLSGWLYNADSRALTGTGRAWTDYVSRLERTVNLTPISVRAVCGVGTAGEVDGAPYLEAAILNNGSTNATGVRVAFRHAGATVASATIPSLSGGAVPRLVRVSWAGMPTSGDVAVEVVVDSDGLIAETNESDNTLAVTVTHPGP